MRDRLRPWPAALLLSTLAAPLAAQEDLGLFFDTVDVNVVNLEVVVTGPDGRPLTGLGRGDFEVYEDGERVELVNFFAVADRRVVGPEGEELGAPGASASLPVPATQRLNLVVFVDNLNLRPQNRKRIFAGLREALAARLDPRDRVMVVTLDDAPEVVQKFTNDSQLVLDILDRLEGNLGRSVQVEAEERLFFNQLLRASERNFNPNAVGGRDMEFEAAYLHAQSLAQEVRVLAEKRHRQVRETLAQLQRFTDSLAGLPGRKAMLYVSDGLPTRPAEGLTEAWIGKYQTWMMANATEIPSHVMRDLQTIATSLNTLQFDASRYFEELTAQASANRVVFYPISYGSRRMAGLSAEFAGASDGAGPMSLDVMNLDAANREMSLLQLAEDTGGVAFTRTANVGDLFQRMVEDVASYYSLGYNRPFERDGEYHRVEVKVRREGAKVRHLEGYREKDALSRLEDATLSALLYDLEDNPLDLRLSVGEQQRTGKDRYRVGVLVKIPFERLLLLPQEQVHSARVSLLVVAGDGKGGLSPTQRIDLPIEIPNERMLEALAGGIAAYPLELEMRAGPQRLSVGALDHLARTEAFVHLDLVVGTEGN